MATKEPMGPPLEEIMAEASKIVHLYCMEANVLTMMGVISQLQLALRHPKNKSKMAGNVRVLVDDLILMIEADSPLLGEFLRLGDNPELDVEC